MAVFKDVYDILKDIIAEVKKYSDKVFLSA